MLEVIAVNDRSTDRTGEILDELVTRFPDRLRVLNVESLPGAGWEDPALYTGAAQATGEWLLFTDADVIFSAGCAEKAVRYAIDDGLDHLTLPPEIVCNGVLLRSFVAAFTLVFEMTQRPWRVSDPQAQEHVGIGAFNLARKAAYETCGTHSAIHASRRRHEAGEAPQGTRLQAGWRYGAVSSASSGTRLCEEPCEG